MPHIHSLNCLGTRAGQFLQLPTVSNAEICNKWLGSFGEGSILFCQWPVTSNLLDWNGLVGPSSFGDNDHTDIYCLPNDPQNQVSSEEATPQAMVAAAEEDVRNLITARKVHNCFRSIIPFQYPRFDMEISRKVQMLFDSIPILL